MTLPEIKQELEQYQTVRCGLFHEGALLDKTSNEPVKTNIAGEEIFARVELCKDEERKQRLGCAHSVANTKFNQLLNSIDPIDPEIQNLQKNFNSLICEIYLLDHKMGNLERDYASLLTSNEVNGIEDIQKEKELTKKEHNALINQLSELKKSIINRVDLLIE